MLSYLILGLAATSFAQQTVKPRDGPSGALLTLHGAAASFPLAIPLDGTTVQTGLQESINIIDVPYPADAYTCNIVTAGERALVFQISPEGVTQVVVGPPQPVLSVSCRGHPEPQQCVAPGRGSCSKLDGTFVAACCPGSYCAGTVCHSM